MSEANKQLIEMYAKQLRTPTFNHYDDVIRQLGTSQGYDDFLVSLMRTELENRQDSTKRRKIKAAHFPYIKTIEEFECSRIEQKQKVKKIYCLQSQ